MTVRTDAIGHLGTRLRGHQATRCRRLSGCHFRQTGLSGRLQAAAVSTLTSRAGTEFAVAIRTSTIHTPTSGLGSGRWGRGTCKRQGVTQHTGHCHGQGKQKESLHDICSKMKSVRKKRKDCAPAQSLSFQPDAILGKKRWTREQSRGGKGLRQTPGRNHELLYRGPDDRELRLPHGQLRHAVS